MLLLHSQKGNYVVLFGLLILNVFFNKTMASYYPTSSVSGPSSSNAGLIKTLISPNKSLMETLFGPDYVMWIIIIVLGIIIIYFILREVRTWYWKINEQIELLKKIEENTRPKTTKIEDINSK